MRMIKAEEVNHCSDCGAEAQMTWNGKEFSVWCLKCKNAVYALTQENALADWNRLNPKSEIEPFTETPKEATDVSPKLKPCPFCGSKNLVIRFTNIVFVECLKCHTEGPDGTNKGEAIEIWNRRAGE